MTLVIAKRTPFFRHAILIMRFIVVLTAIELRFQLFFNTSCIVSNTYCLTFKRFKFQYKSQYRIMILTYLSTIFIHQFRDMIVIFTGTSHVDDKAFNTFLDTLTSSDLKQKYPEEKKILQKCQLRFAFNDSDSKEEIEEKKTKILEAAKQTNKGEASSSLFPPSITFIIIVTIVIIASSPSSSSSLSSLSSSSSSLSSLIVHVI